MSFLNGIARRAPSFSKTFGRFPLPVLASVIATVIANLDIAKLYKLADYNNEIPGYSQFSSTQIYAALIAAFFASGAAHLFAESGRWKTGANYAFAGVVALIAAAPFWLVSGLGMSVLLTFWLPGILLLLMVSGFLRGRTDDLALWTFNYHLGLAVILAGLAALAFILGAYAVLASIDYLFELDLKYVIYDHVYMTGLLLIAPLFGLEMVPPDLHGSGEIEKKGLTYRVSFLLLNYLLLPLLLIYTIVIYAYAAKTALAWELPRGQVGVMVLSFAAGCVSIWMLAIPYRDSSSLLLRLFRRSWYWLLIVPLVLFVIGTYRRVSEYGITPERYGLILLGLWIVGMICLFSIRSSKVQPRVVIATLAIMLMLASFGPWSAAAVSVRDQFGRLVALLEENQILVDGKIAPPQTTDAETREDINSLLTFLSKSGHLSDLKVFFDGNEDENNRFNRIDSVRRLTSLLAGDDARARRMQEVEFYSREPGHVETGGSAFVSGPYTLGNKWGRYHDTLASDLKVELHDDHLRVDYRDQHWTITSRHLLDEVQNRHPASMNEAMPFKLDGSQDQAWLIVNWLNGRLEGRSDDGSDSSNISSLNFTIIISTD
ncbi:MAG: hypothetical protein MnENMB40S_04010 [Rhizobiaceae bacterium MnEN-MB40S]|nr:MAG: hypothetical protein MnENMB40S_04010 [Rhizobiaceae bacterium MnEN-MB40S]